MPYISQVRREEINTLGTVSSNYTPGDLNYQFTLLIKDYIEAKELKYQTINDIIGALEGAKLEFYRRIALPYENSMLTLNGDVYNE